MVKINKGIFVALIAFTMLVASVFANPIEVTDLEIQKENGDYMVLVSLENANVATGVYEDLTFEIEGLGLSKSIQGVRVDSNDTVEFSYNLRELTDAYDSLKKGNTYELTAYANSVEVSELFLFGTEKTTEGLDLIIESVKINGDTINDADVLQVLNGETLDIDMRFSGLENFDDARIRASIDGYEHSVIEDSTPIFEVMEGKTYVKSISINLPSDMDSRKDYKLRIYGANDLSGITYKDYTLYVDTQRHRVDIIDLIMTPSSGVEAGQNIIANVRLKNRGQKDQESVKVSVTIPELDIRESSYVSNLDPQDVVSSDDMLLFVPQDAAAGQYEATVTLSYDDGYTLTTDSFDLIVLASREVAEDELLIDTVETLELASGEETSFDVIVANPNTRSKPISIVASDSAWAKVEITPSLAMVQGGDSKTFTVKVTPRDTATGENTLTLLVKEGSTIANEITVQTFVEEGETSINWINVALAVLLIIAIIILLSLVVTIAKRKNEEGGEEEYSSKEEYY